MKTWRAAAGAWRLAAVLAAHVTVISALLWAVLLMPTLAGAGEHDHDRARRAVQAGEVLPLQELLARLARRQPGQVMEVELEREAGRWVYEIKLLKPDGRLIKLQLDARDGSPLRDVRP